MKYIKVIMLNLRKAEGKSRDLNYAKYELIKALCGNNIKNIILGDYS